MYFPEDRINAMVQRAKRKLLIAPTIPGAGVGSTASSRVGNIPGRPQNRQQSEREGSQLVLTWPAARSDTGVGTMSGRFPTTGYAQQQRGAQQQQIQTNQAILRQIQNEDAANRMTSDEANARALELRNFFQR